MTTQALYNKWRGQTFDDILGQEHVTRTLQNQIRAGRIGHAYLFTGLRGTGKTSLARVMAKAVNCIGGTDNPPCNQCPICLGITAGRSLDLIEIDAASNRGIDEIRDLRDRVAFVPHESRYKVYVIDEVHMLTNEAFNALLKTLEEPPAHVIFILCTTEPHRLPDTILSRCQRFDLRRGSVSILMDKLSRICAQEGIVIRTEALEYIARRAGGSFRDAESLLDQLAAYGAEEITLELVQRTLGTVSSALIAELTRALVARNIPAGLRVINEAVDGGAEPRQFLLEILEHLRALMLLKLGSDSSLQQLGDEALAEMRQIVASHAFSLGLLVRAIKLFNEAGQSLRTAAHPRLPLELAFVEASLDGQGDMAPVEATPVTRAPVTLFRPEPEQPGPTVEPPPALPRVMVVDEPAPAGGKAVAPAAQAETVDRPDEVVSETRVPPATPVVAQEPDAAPQVAAETPADQEGAQSKSQELNLEWVQGNWNLFLIKIKPQSHQIRALLNSTFPVAVKGNTVILGCEADFHREKLMDEKKRDLIERVLSEVLGVPCYMECIVRATPREGALGEAPNAATNQAPRKLFDTNIPNDEPRQSARDELLSHPAVKGLEKLGGRISRVVIYDAENQEDDRGK